jgi:hypothetical protein
MGVTCSSEAERVQCSPPGVLLAPILAQSNLLEWSQAVICSKHSRLVTVWVLFSFVGMTFPMLLCSALLLHMGLAVQRSTQEAYQFSTISMLTIRNNDRNITSALAWSL